MTTAPKHDQKQALDQMDTAISLAQNFSHCAGASGSPKNVTVADLVSWKCVCHLSGADTAQLREVWQRAQRSQESIRLIVAKPDLSVDPLIWEASSAFSWTCPYFR